MQPPHFRPKFYGDNDEELEQQCRDRTLLENEGWAHHCLKLANQAGHETLFGEKMLHRSTFIKAYIEREREQQRYEKDSRKLCNNGWGGDYREPDPLPYRKFHPQPIKPMPMPHPEEPHEKFTREFVERMRTELEQGGPPEKPPKKRHKPEANQPTIEVGFMKASDLLNADLKKKMKKKIDLDCDEELQSDSDLNFTVKDD